MGAEFSASHTHTANGISIRFPRVVRVRRDKSAASATTLTELIQLDRASSSSSAPGTKHTNTQFPSHLLSPILVISLSLAHLCSSFRLSHALVSSLSLYIYIYLYILLFSLSYMMWNLYTSLPSSFSTLLAPSGKNINSNNFKYIIIKETLPTYLR